MITEATAVTLRQNLGDMLNRVQYRGDSIVITRDGKPVAALVDAALFERIRRMQERFDALNHRLARAYAEVPEEEGMAEIERATAQARKDTAAAWRASGRLPPAPERGKAAAARTRPAGGSRKSAKSTRSGSTHRN